ncbi:MAG: hypothetical protein CMF59_08615 [Leptospiraceae bacterium]|nr:hypothetical protein [Leptospiraceae bacterium]
MPAFCQHTRKPLRPLSSIYPSFATAPGSNDFAISDDGVIYYLKANSLDYGPEYFLEEYENQYGKSYLEDESNLRNMARRRLEWMEETIRAGNHIVPWDHPRGPALLEIGSAAGFFLDEARERGFRTTGIEVSGFASDFAEKRGHHIIRQSFLASTLFQDHGFAELAGKANAPKGLDHTHSEDEQMILEQESKLSSQSEAREAYTTPAQDSDRYPHSKARKAYWASAEVPPNQGFVDVIAAFYTLEHFSDQALAFRRLSKLLKPGGLLLLAIPSYHGPVFHCSPAQWLQSHPQDHFADYSPESLARTLDFYGMQQIGIRPASFHKKRMCGWRRFLPDGLYRRWANKESYGDTMEVIARKLDA